MIARRREGAVGKSDFEAQATRNDTMFAALSSPPAAA
jgi:hypothetical protein